MWNNSLLLPIYLLFIVTYTAHARLCYCSSRQTGGNIMWRRRSLLKSHIEKCGICVACIIFLCLCVRYISRKYLFTYYSIVCYFNTLYLNGSIWINQYFAGKYLLVLYSSILYLNGSIKIGNIEVTTIELANILLYYIEFSYI